MTEVNDKFIALYEDGQVIGEQHSSAIEFIHKNNSDKYGRSSIRFLRIHQSIYVAVPERRDEQSEGAQVANGVYVPSTVANRERYDCDSIALNGNRGDLFFLQVNSACVTTMDEEHLRIVYEVLLHTEHEKRIRNERINHLYSNDRILRQQHIDWAQGIGF